MHNNVFKELLLGHMADELEKLLAVKKDEKKALRQALLFIAFLFQDKPDPAGKYFIEFVLTRFPALRKGLKNHRFPFLLDTDFNVVVDGHDTVMVTIHESLLEKLGDAMSKLPEGSQLLSKAYFEQVSERYPFSEWTAAGRRYIGFFDHMGFKNTVDAYKGKYNDLHDILRDIQQKILDTEKIATRQSSKDKYKTSIAQIDTPSGLLKCFQFSDAIMIATRDDSQESYSALILASIMLFVRMLEDGQPIIDAYLLEEAQQWYGVVFDASTQKMDDDPDVPPITPEWIPSTLQFRVPLKVPEEAGATRRKSMQVLNWPAFNASLVLCTRHP